MFTENKKEAIELSKKNSALHKKEINNTCYICNQKKKLINSHSIPKSILSNISKKSMLKTVIGTIMPAPFFKEKDGLDSIETFKLICDDCDKIFEEYENFDYKSEPSQSMLAKIAMKSSLKLIYEKLSELATFKYIIEKLDETLQALKNDVKNQLEILTINNKSYEVEFEYAKNAMDKKNKGYKLGYFQVLDYKVPIAHQSFSCLISDFDDIKINQIYNLSEENKLDYLYISILPLEDKTVIIIFDNSKDNRYDKFYKDIDKRQLPDQLKTIAYIIFSYSKNICYNEDLENKLKPEEWENLKNIVGHSFIPLESDTPDKQLYNAIKELGLSKMHNMPNVLSIKI